MTSSASAASCCCPEVRDGLSCEMALIRSVGQTVCPPANRSPASAFLTSGGASEAMPSVTRRHCVTELMKQVFPKLVRPGGICDPLCGAPCLTPVSEHRLVEALEGTCLAGHSDLVPLGPSNSELFTSSEIPGALEFE